MQVKVSVIVPCYNYAKYLPFALDSVLAQDMEHWECIVVDDGSGDETGRVAREYVHKDARFKYVYQQNRGLSAARNTGVENSLAEYLQFLDADDLIDSGKLSKQAAYLDANGGVDVVYGDEQFFHTERPEEKIEGRNKEDNKYQYLKRSGRGVEMMEAFCVDNFIPVSAPLVRRSLVDKIGDFDTSYRSYEDWHFWFRATMADAGFKYFPEDGTETFIRFGHTSMLSNKNRIVEAGIKLRQFMMPELPLRLKGYNAYRLLRLYAHKAALAVKK